MGMKAMMTKANTVQCVYTRVPLELHLPLPSSALSPALIPLTGVDRGREFHPRLRDICLAEIDPAIRHQIVPKSGVGLGGVRVFLDSPALPWEGRKPLCHCRLGLPSVCGLSGNEHGV